jgi:hypothetical protein
LLLRRRSARGHGQPVPRDRLDGVSLLRLLLLCAKYFDTQKLLALDFE